ncbi:hypothetical protein Vretimale_13923, partial [Volvox reticuliferus]
MVTAPVHSLDHSIPNGARPVSSYAAAVAAADWSTAGSSGGGSAAVLPPPIPGYLASGSSACRGHSKDEALYGSSDLGVPLMGPIGGLTPDDPVRHAAVRPRGGVDGGGRRGRQSMLYEPGGNGGEGSGASGMAAGGAGWERGSGDVRHRGGLSGAVAASRIFGSEDQPSQVPHDCGGGTPREAPLPTLPGWVGEIHSGQHRPPPSLPRLPPAELPEAHE